MDNITYIILVLVVSLGFLAGAAYLIEKKSKAAGRMSVVEPTKIQVIWKWYIRGMVSLLVLLLVVAWIFHDLLFVWIGLGVITVGIFIRKIYDIYNMILHNK